MSATGELTGCPRSGCPGSIRPTGYCNTCGMAPPAPSPPQQEASERSERTSSRQVDVGRLVSRPTTQPVRLHRSQVGAGVVYVEPQRELDPDEMVTPVPSVPENRRFCSSCSKPVGRGHDGRPGRVRGYCSNCREPFDFTKGRARGRPSLEPGDLVAGQYQVTETLDHGGMGWIYLARDLNVSERPCVLKGLIAHGDEVAAEAAEAERRHLAELSHHPNIVTIHNFVNYEGQGYIVMEYVGGRSLKEKWELHREEVDEPLPVTDVISYLYAVLPAFGYMHARNRVYCDFKPDNVMHVEDEVKLIDLGAVRRFDDHDAPIYGTPSYQAPEVWPATCSPSAAPWRC
jgi:serine/threonine-protein kinase PknG